MAEVGVITTRTCWVGAYEVPSLTSLATRREIEAPDDTVLGDTARSVAAAGLENGRIEGAGFWNSDGTSQVDDLWAAYRGTNDLLVTVACTSAADGERADFLKADWANLAPGAAVGEMFRFDLSAWARGHPLVPGSILKYGSVSATGNGTAYQLGAVSASQYVYAGLHVLAVSGDRTITAVVASDPVAGFTTDTARITFSVASAIGYEYATPVAGAITDTYWRAEWTIGGTTGSITALIVMGITR